jgi:hypothetical protein
VDARHALNLADARTFGKRRRDRDFVVDAQMIV